MSGETAYGDYPIEATTMMSRIMKYTEEKRSELVHFTAVPEVSSPAYTKATEILAEAASTNAQAIVISSDDMDLIRALSAHRPEALIVPVCTRENDARELMLAYGVRPFFSKTLDLEAVFQAIHASSLPKDQHILVVEQAGGQYATKTMVTGKVAKS